MKIALLTATAFALLLVPSAWMAANAHGADEHSGTQGMHMMKPETFAWGHPGTAGAVDRTIRIKAEDSMRFVPDTLTVKTGQTVKFVITNTGRLTHEFVLAPKSVQKEHEKEMRKMMQSMMQSDGMHMKMGGMMQAGKMHMQHSDPYELELPAGETKTLIWTFTQPGTLQYGCHEPGHYAAGMVGTITVTKGQ